MRKGYLFFFLLFISAGVWGQTVVLTTGSPTYLQDFTSPLLSSTTTVVWINNSTISSWYAASLNLATNGLVIGTGSSGTGNLNNYGSTSATDRTLGSLASGGTSTLNYGVLLSNGSTANIISLRIQYIGEQWRNGGNATTQNLSFDYSTTSTSINSGTYTSFSGLNFTSPIATASASALDGNLSANRTSLDQTITGLNIIQNGTIMLRWTDLNDSGNDHGLGIDDIVITATYAASNTITTGIVSTPPFILASCAATATGTVDFTSTDAFAGGNIFKAQLSDDIGSFTTPVNIGSILLSGTAPNGTINITIPAGTVGGTGYKVRVISDNPIVTGTLSSAFIITQNGLGGCSSSHSDYYRSVQTGNWDDVATWQSSSDGSNWVVATLAPTSLANTITISNTYIVTVAANASADQVQIQSGGTLIYSAGTLTIDDGIGDDIEIQNGGVFTLSFANNPPLFGSGTPIVNVASGGILRVSAAGLTAVAPTNGVNVSNYVYNHQSILEYTLSGGFTTNNAIYFPNVIATVIPIFRATNPTASNLIVGSANPTIFNGVFEYTSTTADLIWQNSGNKIFRNGIRGAGNFTANASASTAKFIINGTTAELGGTGSLVVPMAGGLEIGSASGTTVSVTSNKFVTGDISLISTNTYVELGAFNLTVTGAISNGGANAYIRTNGAGALTLGTVTSKTFPIGIGNSYNPLTISNGNSADYSGRVEVGINPGIAFPTFGINRTWNIIASAVTPNVGVVFQYATADANAGALPQAQPMEILQNTGVWNIITGNTNISPGGADPAWTVTTTTALSINTTATPYALGINGGFILPLDCIVSCRSKKMNNTGIISWDINSCAEVKSFEVQRSINGGLFQTVTTKIPGAALEYSYTDASLVKGTSLYRIKVNRSSGAIKYSNTVAIINDGKGLLITALSPNPVNDKTTFVINAANASAVNFIIYDMMGRPVKQWQTAIAEGSNNITVNAGKLSAGIYHLAATTADAKTVMRFVKQ